MSADVSPDPDRPPDGRQRPIRLLVVDADRRVRATLAGLLALAAEVEVVGSAGHVRAAVETCGTERPDAIVIDPRLPELPDGVALIRGLRRDHPAVRVVVVAWTAGLARLFADDPRIIVVAADGGDLADRIVEVLRSTGQVAPGAAAEAAATLEATA